MRLPHLSPRAYQRVTALALCALVFIVITGGAVRLTGSGLGCTDWPNCSDDRLVAPWEYHAMVEFVNRLVTGAVSAVVIVAVLGARLRSPRRGDLSWLAAGLVAGVLAQIVLGGITVLLHLHPVAVMSHFVVSMVLIANAVVLHDRAAQPDHGDYRPAAGPRTARWATVVVLAAAVVLVAGTVVTASGPHGGDEDVRRLGFALRDVARIHGAAVIVFLAATLAALRVAVREGAAPTVIRRGTVLLAVSVAQAGVGYAQYFSGVPPFLVGVHIAGATAVWIAALRLRLALRVRAAEARAEAEPRSEVSSLAPA